MSLVDEVSCAFFFLKPVAAVNVNVVVYMMSGARF